MRPDSLGQVEEVDVARLTERQWERHIAVPVPEVAVDVAAVVLRVMQEALAMKRFIGREGALFEASDGATEVRRPRN